MLQTWRTGALKAAGRHAAACDHFERWDSRLGMATTVLAAVVGSTAFVTLQHATSFWVTIGAGLLGVTAAILAGIQTTAKFGARSERHRQASRQYGALVRAIEELRALPPPAADLRGNLDTLRKAFDEAGGTAPDVPPDIWNQRPPGRLTSHDLTGQAEQQPDLGAGAVPRL